MSIRTHTGFAVLFTSVNMVTLSLPAFGQEAPADATPSTVVVTGYKKSYTDALVMKRQAIGVSDSISAEGMDRFPDLNVGEALQRIPGIQVNREEDGRSASINLRGLPSAFAKITMNGMDFAAPVLGGAAPMGAFDSDIFSSFTVVKSVSAAEQSGGIAGNIDMVIAPALSRKEGLSVKVAAEHNTLGSYTTPKTSFNFASKFLDGRLGVFANLAAKKEEFRRDSLYVNQFTQLSPVTTPDFLSRFADYYAADCTGKAAPCVAAPGGTGRLSNVGVTAPTDIRQAARVNDGRLVSGAFGAEYRLSPELKIGGHYFFTDRSMKNTSLDLLDIDLRDANTIINPTGAPYQHTDGRYYVSDYTFTNPRVYGSMRKEPFKQKADGLNLRGTFQNDDWRVEANGILSKATNYGYQAQVDVRNTAKSLATTGGAGNGITGSVGLSGGLENYLLAFNQASPALGAAQTTGPWTWGGAGNAPTVTNTNGDVFIVAGTDNYADNTVKGLRLDTERFLDLPWLESVQGGLQYNRNEYNSQTYRSSAAGFDYSQINGSFVVPSAFSGDYFGGNAGNYLQNWQTVDYDKVAGTLQPTLTGSGLRTASGWVNDPSDGGFTSNNFSKDDEIKALYLMAKLDGKVAGVKVRGHVGIRHEETKQTVVSMDRVGTGATATFRTGTRETTYKNNLPSMLLAADLTDKLVLRYGNYKTFIRPNGRDISPLTTSITQDVANGGYTVSLGRTDIAPYTSKSQDLALEYYNRPNGLVGLALYRKNIHGMIVAENRNAALCPADGYGLGLGSWSVVGDRCVSDLAAPAGAGLNGKYTINVSGAVNSPNDLIAEGAELTVQQAFDFLPAPFNGMGGVFNYSYTRIKGKAPDGTQAFLNNVSPRSANLILYYETPAWGVRGVYNWRDDYNLPSGGTFSGEARSVKARGQFDLSASYKITENLSVAVDGFNLTDSFREEYEGSMAKLRRADYDGRTFQATLRYTFF
ncbi:TonB-dependent receptor [Pseudoduganella lurida]|uniref:TonB-dependent receptor n=1 Tax=Pseudoduganella lurida TaxID=1036180 RepID=A0A562RL68_9BURK|nr:TonB-dependent receptor [Pseudoduganella lurida]TWI69792.1 TonB-dependent receptor [Pseudoduganella lurida]